MNYLQAKAALAHALSPAAKEEAFLEAGFMLEALLGKGGRQELNPTEEQQLDAWVQRRLQGEPLQYVLGEWEFMGLPMKVRPGVLIPRPETELMCELALSLLPPGSRLLDLCCGSGCIGIALAKLGGMQLSFSDISRDALAVTRENAGLHGIQASFYEGDLFSPLKGQRFDAILCNPPYLTGEEMDARQIELYYEPDSALYGGADGLNFYRRLSREADSYLKHEGLLLMEIGCSQGQAVQALFPGSRVYKDLSGQDRTVVYIKE